MHIGFLGFGEAARAFQESLKVREPALRFSAWDIVLQDADTSDTMREDMRSRDVTACGPEGLREVDLLFSAVTADQSYIALKTIAPHLVQGQTLIDMNSVSPDRKRQSAELIGQAGATYLDMAVMAPVHPKGHATPVLIAGDAVEVLASVLTRFGFDFHVVGEKPGAATAIKMVRSLFVKGLEAITVEALLAAQASGCFDEVMASLSKSFGGLSWPDFPAYQFERTLKHGKRRAAEMRESAETIAALGLHGSLATEIAAVQDKMGDAGANLDKNRPLADLVAAVLAARSTN